MWPMRKSERKKNCVFFVTTFLNHSAVQARNVKVNNYKKKTENVVSLGVDESLRGSSGLWSEETWVVMAQRCERRLFLHYTLWYVLRFVSVYIIPTNIFHKQSISDILYNTGKQ